MKILSLLIILLFSFSVYAQQKANIVFVFADQMRNHAINGEDPTITPNLDNLSQQAVRFNNAISTAPVCTPYRGMLITGKHPLTTGVTVNCSPNNPNLYLRPDEYAFGNIFKSNGYQTAYIGKWHLDDPQTAIPLLGYSPDGNRGWDTYTPPGPKRQGFDFWHAYNAFDDHLAPHYWENNVDLIEPGKWSVEHETDVAIEYIENRDQGKPFLLMMSYLPPHGPYSEVPEKYKAFYNYQTPQSLLNRENLILSGEGAKAEDTVNDYFAAVTGIDEQLGRLIFYLKEENLFNNTIFIFSADHGEMMGSHGHMYKSKWYEEAINVPLIVSYPDQLNAGENDCLVAPVDFLPTLLALSAHEVPQGYYGKDLSEAFLGNETAHQDTVFLNSYGGNPYTDVDSLWMTKGWRGLRTKTHTFVVRLLNGKRTYELYDNVNDKWQLNPLRSNNPEEYSEFKEFYQSLVRHLNEQSDLFLENLGDNNNPYSLLENAGFELGLMDGWNTWNNGITYDSTHVYEGNWSGFIKNEKEGSLQQKVNLKSNTDYQLNVTAKVNAPGEFAKIIVRDHGFPKITKNVNTTEFQQYSVSFTTGEITGESIVSLYKATKNFGNIYADNFELYEVGDEVTEIQITPEDKDGPIFVNGNPSLFRAFVIPVTALNKEVSWAVENFSGEALVDQNGWITPLQSGEIILSATSVSNPEVSASINVEIRSSVSRNYYVDGEYGSDQNDGLSIESSWKSLEKVNNNLFIPGDSILFKSGGIWNGQLEINCKGQDEKPIVFSKFGSGPKPLINGEGKKDYTVRLLNTSFTEFSSFEITNQGENIAGGRYAVLMIASNEGSIYDVVLRDLDVHDVNGDPVKDNGSGGGIRWRIEGDIPSRFVNSIIEDCHIYDCQRDGIKGSSQYYKAEYQGIKDYYNLNFIVRRNLIERIPGDGIVMLGCYEGVAEYNVCRDFTNDLPVGDAAAGIWPWNSIKTIIQHNEVSGHKAGWDGQGFDSDYNCDSTIIQYNYSHDNCGGFILICSNGQWNGYNNNTIVRYNISVNDGYRTWGNGENFCPSIHLAGNIFNTRVYNNTFYLGPKPVNVDNLVLEATKWHAWPDKTIIENNLFYSVEDSEIKLAQSTSNFFSNNLYSETIEPVTGPFNVIGDPLFMDPGQSDEASAYSLTLGSPAYMAGKIIPGNGGQDYFGNPVYEDVTPNIGAFNGDLLNIINETIHKGEESLFIITPNPCQDSFVRVKNLVVFDNAKLSLLNLHGKLIEQKDFDRLEIGKHVDFDLSNCRNGAYIIKLEILGKSTIRKFILL